LRRDSKNTSDKAKAIAVLIAQTAPQYYRADFGAAQAALLLDAFVDDLVEFTTADIENAFRAYRRDTKNKFFPTSGQIRALASGIVRDRAERDRHARSPRLDPNHVLRRPQFWWLLPYWNADWGAHEIPYEFRAAFDRHLKRNGSPKVYRREATP
jgi:hypothetical protein